MIKKGSNLVINTDMAFANMHLSSVVLFLVDRPNQLICIWIFIRCVSLQSQENTAGTRSSWLNCALRDDEAVYWASIGHYETVAVSNW